MIKKVGKKYVLYSKTKKSGRRKRLGTFSSRGSAMKREKQIQYFKNLKEEAAGNVASAVVGSVGSAAVLKKKGKKGVKPKIVKLEEDILREAVRRLIALSTAKYYEDVGQKTLQEAKLRRVIRTLLNEKSEPIPYKNTGLNTAAEVLQRIKRTIVDAYKSLTSSKEQRRDFTNTVEELVKKAIEQQEYMKEIDKSSGGGTSPTQVASLEEADEEVASAGEDDLGLGDLEITDSEAGGEEVVPLGEPEESDQEKTSKQSKQIATDIAAKEPDTTGGAKAIPVITTIVPQILLARDTLKDEKDKQAFDLAILGGNGKIGNIKAFINLAEKELSATVSTSKQGSLEDELTSDASGQKADIGDLQQPSDGSETTDQAPADEETDSLTSGLGL
jgi:hypothetical protein